MISTNMLFNLDQELSFDVLEQIAGGGGGRGGAKGTDIKGGKDSEPGDIKGETDGSAGGKGKGG
ncbi:MAG: hypothetical protein ACPGXL_03685 [Chitinophagales bacterium]